MQTFEERWRDSGYNSDSFIDKDAVKALVDAEIAALRGRMEALENTLRFILAKEEEGYVSFCGMPWKKKIQDALDSPLETSKLATSRNKQVPEETVSSPEHQEWLGKRKQQDPLNPTPIERLEQMK